MRTRAAFIRPSIIVFALFVSAALPACAGDLRPIKLIIGGREAPRSAAIFDGREVYVSLETLKLFGAGHRLTRRHDAAEVFAANSRTFEIGLARIKGGSMIPLTALAAKLDAEVSVTETLCNVRARIAAIDFSDDSIRISSTFPVELRSNGKSGSRIWVTITIPGAAAPVGYDTLKPGWGSPGVLASKVEEDSSGVVIRLQLSNGVTAQPGAFSAAREHVLALDRSPRAAIASVKQSVQPDPRATRGVAHLPSESATRREPNKADSEARVNSTSKSGEASPRAPRDTSGRDRAIDFGEKIQDPDSVDTVPPAVPPATRVEPAPTAGLTVSEVSLKGGTPSIASLRIGTTGRVDPVIQVLGSPDRLVIDIPGCGFAGETREWSSNHALVGGIYGGEGEVPGTSRIIVTLNRLVGYRMVQSGIDGFTLALAVSRTGPARSMSDLIIVVDAGHGGPATGCRVKVGSKVFYEKNITLSISKRLRALLEEAGANVLMTRTEDVNVGPEGPKGLYMRSGLANDNNANLFVSVHVDWIGKSGPRGSTVYHHMYSSGGRELGKNVMARIAEVSGIPSRGVVSDRKLYPNGLAVLRTSAMPAILVETGFLSNPSDREKLLDERWHQNMAQAIFDGIRDFVEGSNSTISSSSVEGTN